MEATSSPPGWVLWAGTVGMTGSVDQRIKAVHVSKPGFHIAQPSLIGLAAVLPQCLLGILEFSK